MGAHSTFEDHLKGVQAFHAPLTDGEQDGRQVKSSKSLKNSKASKRKEGSKHKNDKKRDKAKEKKSKHKKDKKRHDNFASDHSSSDDDVDTQLEKGRAAVRITREILDRQISLKQELRQLLWRIDQGEAVQITGIPVVWLRDALRELFKNLSLASSSKGIFVRKQGASPCLQLLGPVISEARAAAISQSTADPPASAQTAPAGVSQAPNGILQPAAGAETQPKSQADVHAEPAALHSGDGPVSAHGGDAPQPPPPGNMPGDEVIMTTAEHPAAEADMAADVAEPAVPVAGPAMPPGWAPEALSDAPELEAVTEEGALSGRAAVEAAVREEGVDRVGQLAEGSAEGKPMLPPAAAQRPIAGPARPPDELLAAAAEVHQAMMDEPDDYDELIGPAPPELLSEVEAAGDDDRAKEVVRVIRSLGAPKEADSYAVMGLEPDAKSADVKRRYMRLSLLIHPDKCSHPQAQHAFQAVSKASKLLQDPASRKALDASREDGRLRELATQAAAQEERERQWRVARGTATAEDLRGPIQVGPAQRDTWMTDLPEARRANAVPTQVNVTTFSQSRIPERGDTRGWTETPQQKLLRLSAAEQQRPQALEAAAQPQDSAAARAVDAYNQSQRPKTLVEEHQDKLKAEKRQKKKRKAEEKQKQSNAVAGGGDDSWNPALHPWRPFDRDKDLGMGPKLADKDQLMKSAGDLTSRFGSKAGQRKFL